MAHPQFFFRYLMDLRRNAFNSALSYIFTSIVRMCMGLIPRPDTALLLMIELTVPWEDCINKANETRQAKYQELEGTGQGRKPIVIECKGFTGRLYTLLGITGAAKRKAIRASTEATERGGIG